MMLGLTFGLALIAAGTVTAVVKEAEKEAQNAAADVETEAETIFTIANKNGFNGKLVIEDNGLQYDNTFYFNFNALL